MPGRSGPTPTAMGTFSKGTPYSELYRTPAATVQVKTTLNVPRTIEYIDKRCLGRAFVTVSSFIFFSHHSCSKCFCVLMIFFLSHRRLSVRRVFPAHPSSFPNPLDKYAPGLFPDTLEGRGVTEQKQIKQDIWNREGGLTPRSFGNCWLG